MSNPIGVAVIGAGMAGRAHCAGYRAAPTLFDPPLPPIRYTAVIDADEGVAKDAATRYGYQRHGTDWRTLLDDDEVQVVSVVVANHLHRPIVEDLLAAGKHVLAEKPFASNAAEAREVAAAAQSAGVTVVEAFHYAFHPLFQRVCALLAEGAVGQVEHVESILRMPAPPDGDPRWSLELAGGAMMDLGCYSLHSLRQLGLRYFGGEPTVVSAKGSERDGRTGVDEAVAVDLAYPSGVTASGGSHMNAPAVDFHLTLTGSEGVLHVPDFPRPHENDSLILRRSGAPEVVEHLGTRSSYTYQLEALAAHLRLGTALPHDITDTVPQAELIDAAYRAAGFAPRPTYVPEVQDPSH